jgi:sugar phosphate isomerase/epimerase
MELRRASLNSITTRGADLDTLIALAVNHQLPGVGLWRDVYATVGAPAAARRLANAGLRVTSVCRGGMFTHDTATQKQQAWAENQRAVEETRDLGADCLVLVCGGAPHGNLPRARGQIRDGIDQLCSFAADAGVSLAIEPMNPMMIADRSAITSLGEANDLIADLGHDNLGIALDAYHVFWDAKLAEEIARASGRLMSVQVCDWVVPIHHQLSSRGMPGEGSIDLAGFVSLAEQAGYAGLIEVEVLSEHWWAQTPAAAAEAAVAGFANI